MTVYKSVSELIGGTPLVELTNYEKNNDLDAIIVVVIVQSPSVKDRVAIDDRRALLRKITHAVLIDLLHHRFLPPSPPRGMPIITMPSDVLTSHLRRPTAPTVATDRAG